MHSKQAYRSARLLYKIFLAECRKFNPHFQYAFAVPSARHNPPGPSVAAAYIKDLSCEADLLRQPFVMNFLSSAVGVQALPNPPFSLDLDPSGSLVVRKD